VVVRGRADGHHEAGAGRVGCGGAAGVEGGVGSVAEQLVDGAGEPGIRVQVLGGARRRPRLPTPRGYRVVVRLSDEERAAVAADAARLGLSAGAFLSAAGLAVARGEGPRVDAGVGVSEPSGVDRGAGGVGLDRRTGDALDDLETQLGRVGNLLNQAVRVAHSTGEVDGRLLGAADAVRRLAGRVNGVLDGVRLDRRGRAR